MSIAPITLDKPRKENKTTEINLSLTALSKKLSPAEIRDLVVGIFKSKFSMSPKSAEIDKAQSLISKSNFSDESQIEMLLSVYIDSKDKFGDNVQVEATSDRDGNLYFAIREDDGCGNPKSLVGTFTLSKEDIKGDKNKVKGKIGDKLAKIKDMKKNNNIPLAKASVNAGSSTSNLVKAIDIIMKGLSTTPLYDKIMEDKKEQNKLDDAAYEKKNNEMQDLKIEQKKFIEKLEQLKQYIKSADETKKMSEIELNKVEDSVKMIENEIAQFRGSVGNISSIAKDVDDISSKLKQMINSGKQIEDNSRKRLYLAMTN